MVDPAAGPAVWVPWVLPTLIAGAQTLRMIDDWVRARKTREDGLEQAVTGQPSAQVQIDALDKEIARLDAYATDTRKIAHDARNIANATQGQLASHIRQSERDHDRYDKQQGENTRRIDELVARLARSGEGV